MTREDLQAAVWGDSTFVDFDRGLNFCVLQIRNALGVARAAGGSRRERSTAPPRRARTRPTAARARGASRRASESVVLGDAFGSAAGDSAATAVAAPFSIRWT